MKTKFVSVVVISTLLLVALSGCGLAGDLKTVNETGKSFMTALQNMDYTTSFNLLTPSVQEEVGGDAGWQEWAAIRAFPEWSFSSTNIENNQGQMEGEATLDGITYDVVLIFDQVNDAWLVSGISFQAQ
ncbi:MAG TPA: hypothetical protein PK040_03060 [Anaerolineaceae bacterium]|nr:hypothetical protein [Anaerolineaceae bacterium]